MHTLFLTCGALGAALLALQLVLGLLGLDHHDFDHAGFDHDASGGGGATAFQLPSLRAVAAALLFLGLAGMLAESVGAPAPLALAAALLAGGGVGAGVQYSLRAMRRLESDGAARLESSIGSQATVYLAIPGGGALPGKVHLHVQNRLVECRAVSDQPIPTGNPVVVVDVLGPDLVQVAPPSQPWSLP